MSNSTSTDDNFDKSFHKQDLYNAIPYFMSTDSLFSVLMNPRN